MNHNILPLPTKENAKSELLKEWTPGYVRIWMGKHNQDYDTALATACVCNHYLWLSKLPPDAPKTLSMMYEEDWWWLRSELVYKCFDKMAGFSENSTRENLPFDERYKRIAPFMDKYGFVKENDWWVCVQTKSPC